MNAQFHVPYVSVRVDLVLTASTLAPALYKRRYTCSVDFVLLAR